MGEIEAKILAMLRKYHFVGVDTMGFIYHMDETARWFRRVNLRKYEDKYISIVNKVYAYSTPLFCPKN